jgi:hypothetical protein
VAGEVERAFAAGDSREAHESGRALVHPLEHIGASDVRERVRQLEKAMRAVAARMHDRLGDPLMVKVADLFAKMRVLGQNWTARVLLQ